MKKISIEEQQELASKLLKVDIDIIKKCAKVVDESNTILVTLTDDGKQMPAGYKGGIRLVVNEYGEVLYCASSAISNEKMLNDFSSGRRTPIAMF